MPNTTKANSLKCILIEPNIPNRSFCEGEIRLNRSYPTAAVRFFFFVVFVSFLTKLSEIRFLSVVFFRNFCSCFANVFSCGKTLQVCCVSEQGGGLQGIRIRRVKTEGHVRSHL